MPRSERPPAPGERGGRCPVRVLGRLRFDSLRVRNYRLFFLGQLVSIAGNWMESVAQSFLVLQLTGSGTQLGLVTAVRFGPMFVLGPWAGLVADRLDRRRVLTVTQVLSASGSLAFCVLVGTGHITMPAVYGLSLVLGLISTFDQPARQSLIPDLVPPEHLGNAVSLNSVTANLARTLGAAFGGVIAAALGLTLCFGLNALSFLVVVGCLVAMHRDEIAHHEPSPRRKGQVREGFAYVARTPDLLVPLTMIAVLGTLAWEFPVSLPLLARETFHGDAGTYGAMTAAMGLGGVAGGLVAAARVDRRTTAISFSALGWGVFISAAALAPSTLTAYLALVLVGYSSITFNSTAKTILQLRADPAMRGRVMALWALAWMGSTPIGSPIVGWVGEHVGARWGLLLGGITAVAIGLASLPALRRIDRRDALATLAPSQPAVTP